VFRTTAPSREGGGTGNGKECVRESAQTGNLSMNG